MSFQSPTMPPPTLDNVNMSLLASPSSTFVTPSETRRRAAKGIMMTTHHRPTLVDATPPPPNHRLYSIQQQQQKSHQAGRDNIDGLEDEYEEKRGGFEDDARSPNMDTTVSFNENSFSHEPHEQTENNVPFQQADSLLPTYSPLVEQAATWIRDLETIRNDMNMMLVENAILLDTLTMAGADVQDNH